MIAIMKFTNVTAEAKANVYFDGKVVSHGVTLEDGSTKTFGLIFTGKYHFDTKLAERMERKCKEFEEWPQLKAKEQSVRGMSAAQSFFQS